MPLVFNPEQFGDRSTRQAARPTPISTEDAGSRGSGTSGITDLNAIQVYGMNEYVTIYEQDLKTFVTFVVTPEMSESKTVNYIEINEIRQAGSILIFIGSPGRTFSVNVKLISRNAEEAAANFKRLSILKSWGMPSKGIAGTVESTGEQLDSDAPKVLYLKGYGALFKRIQVVMKSINIEYPADSDYISSPAPQTEAEYQASLNAPIGDDSESDSDNLSLSMPIILPISMTFQEIRAGQELTNFDIAAYKSGTLEHW